MILFTLLIRIGCESKNPDHDMYIHITHQDAVSIPEHCVMLSPRPSASPWATVQKVNVLLAHHTGPHNNDSFEVSSRLERLELDLFRPCDFDMTQVSS